MNKEKEIWQTHQDQHAIPTHKESYWHLSSSGAKNMGNQKWTKLREETKHEKRLKPAEKVKEAQ